MNQNYEYHTDELLAKWLAGEASEKELQVLQNWMDASAENKKYADQFATIWNSAENEDSMNLNIQHEWESQLQMRKKSAGVWKVIYNNKFAIAAAASIAIIAIIWRSVSLQPTGFLADMPTEKGIFIQAGQEAYTTILPDKTEVTLEPYSQLRADSNFNSSNRIVHLKGAAKFKTIHGKPLLFTVKHGETTIKDIGTVFYVYGKEKYTSVAVLQGIVDVVNLKDSVRLYKGDTAEITTGLDQIRMKKQSEGSTEKEVRGKTISFQNTELSKVVSTLNAAYKVDLRISNNAIGTCKFTATFSDETLDNILDVIQETFNIKVQKNGNIIYLDGKGCR
ncbi:MAG: FecR family protein [Bacteroidetes bacterium]|nr:FecR family protein [Bacteroidota bacterium]